MKIKYVELFKLSVLVLVVSLFKEELLIQFTEDHFLELVLSYIFYDTCLK